MKAGYNEEISKHYYGEFQKIKNKYESFERGKTLRLIDSPLKGRIILDAGSGPGHEVAFLNKKGALAFGIDASKHLINISKNNYPDLANKFFVGDIKKLPFKNNFFDIIICKYVLHYLSKPDLAFKEFFRCLKKNGILIFSVHHPISNLFFSKSKNYFKKGKIKIEIFPSVNVVQHIHTLSDYFSRYFLKHFDLNYFEERRGFKPLHPKINIPEHFLAKAKKKI